MTDILKIGTVEFHNRLFTGTGKFSSKELIQPMLEASESEMITVALRRVDYRYKEENILEFIPKNVRLLPNTSGARTAAESVRIAEIARAAGCGDFIKIEVIRDMKYLMPDNYETLKATELLAGKGFIVLPYVSPDINITRDLENAGASAVMPLGSPIGSHGGLKTKMLLEMVIETSNLPVIIDAGIGRPSHAAEAMEMGADAVLVNTAISAASDPVSMGRAFKNAVEAGRTAFLCDLAEATHTASPSSPLTGFLNL